jgi:hypothetical protein
VVFCVKDTGFGLWCGFRHPWADAHGYMLSRLSPLPRPRESLVPWCLSVRLRLHRGLCGTRQRRHTDDYH